MAGVRRALELARISQSEFGRRINDLRINQGGFYNDAPREESSEDCRERGLKVLVELNC